MEAAISDTLLTIATPFSHAFSPSMDLPFLVLLVCKLIYQMTRHCGYFLGHSSPLKKSRLRTQLLTSAEGMNTGDSCLTDHQSHSNFFSSQRQAMESLEANNGRSKFPTFSSAMGRLQRVKNLSCICQHGQDILTKQIPWSTQHNSLYSPSHWL